MLVAARYFVPPTFPIKPVSTIPTKGIAMFEKNTGMDNDYLFLKILLNILLISFSALKYIINLYTPLRTMLEQLFITFQISNDVVMAQIMPS